MRLVQFSLQNYRSIRRTEQLSLSDLTALVGPNNEGKSNILSGLVAGMRLLEMHARYPMNLRRGAVGILGQAQRGGAFDLERDVPIALQGRAGTQTTFDFEFELTEDEVLEFRESVKSNLN